MNPSMLKVSDSKFTPALSQRTDFSEWNRRLDVLAGFRISERRACPRPAHRSLGLTCIGGFAGVHEILSYVPKLDVEVL
jgi:hypothetical protein